MASEARKAGLGLRDLIVHWTEVLACPCGFIDRALIEAGYSYEHLTTREVELLEAVRFVHLPCAKEAT